MATPFKILHFTDPHVRGNKPASRLDNFPLTIIRKIKWVVQKAIELRVNVVIITGDILNNPDISYSMLGKLMGALNELKEHNIIVEIVIGNHDIYGQNAATFDRTPLYLLERIGVIERLSLEPKLFAHRSSYEMQEFQVQITGADFSYLQDKDGRVSEYVDVPNDFDAVCVHATHGFLTPNPLKWEGVSCTAIDAILSTRADIVLTGHEHSGFGIINVPTPGGQKTFINPGALARVTAGVGDINLEVKIDLIEIYDRHCWEASLIPLPGDIALPADVVLDREKLEEEKKHRKELDKFSENISSISSGSFTFDIYKALDVFIAENNIDPKVVSIMLNRLQKAEEKIAKARKGLTE